MASNPQLRAVTDGEKPPTPAAPRTLKEAAERGERELLMAMRTKISDTIEAGVPAHTMAPLMRQMHAIDKEIRQFDLRARQESDTRGRGAVDDTYDPSII